VVKRGEKMVDFPEIPGYRIIDKLGEGGVATVYLGIQEKIERKTAIKILDPFLLKDNVTRERFEREATILACLSHANIVQIFDISKSGDYFYIAMEYMEESLKDFMQRYPGNIVDPVKALDIVEAIMKALDYAHFRGIFHRDIKPDNIMFRWDGTPVLMDFGIAKIYEDKKNKNIESRELTFTGQSMGTVHYMSPEQCIGKKDIEGRSDIYSLGAVLYEMLTGKKPYQGNTPISISLKHIEAAVPCLPEGLERYQELIDKMMAKDIKKRLSSAPQFRELLGRILTTSDSSSPQPVISPTNRSGKTSTGLSPQKEVIIAEPFFNRFIDSIYPVRSFFNVVKKIFAPFKEYMKNTLQFIDDVPYRYKLILLIFFIVSIIVLLHFVFYTG
jgi:serine/threonine-protein kinase PpkA